MDERVFTDIAQSLERAVHDALAAISAVVNPGGPIEATSETMKLAYSAALLVLARIIATADDPDGWLLRNAAEILPQMAADARAYLRDKGK